MGLRGLLHLRKPHSTHGGPQATQIPALPPGDTPLPLRPGRKVKPEEIRELGELIRKRYELDVEIWDLRYVEPRDRPVVEDKMYRADAILKKIYATINAWDSPAAFDTNMDWSKLQQIKGRIRAGGQRTWAVSPPWED